MKTRSRDRRRTSGQKTDSKTRGTAVQVKKEDPSNPAGDSPGGSKTPQELTVSHETSAKNQPGTSVTSFTEASNSHMQPQYHHLGPTTMLSPEPTHQHFIHSSSPVPHAKMMETNQQPQQCGSGTVSPTHTPVPVSAHDSQYAGQQGNVSPVQLTELVPSTVYKTYSPPSDTNHNVTTMYGYHNNGYGVSNEETYTTEYHGKAPGVYCAQHYPDTYEDKAKALSNTDRYSASPNGYGYYPRDSHYQLHNSFTPAAGVCKTYNFLAAESGSEHSSPELAPYTHSNTVTYTPPLTTSSTGSPQSSHCSPASTGPNTSREGALPDTTRPAHYEESSANNHSHHSANSSSAAPASSYYSDEQSTEGDSIREIQQEILRADIERHIYENYSQNLTVYPSDEDSDAESENFSPTSGSSSPRKSSSGSKKRRRRMQTPVQRSAANLRERKRMCHLNTAFDSLKDRLPNVRNRKKLSRIQTLRAAIFYISLLSECVQSS
ncbi:protein atonal-like [Littorina saxatilis]|uniref:BHLH domain-containing protein n=1 Tax=Littorina saxatilis TaxID=31220 RepID=A0AAN9BQ27_9CAEN